MICPRTQELGAPSIAPGTDHTDQDHCSYCGSLLPDIFMQLLLEQKIVLQPTDKNYKVYVKARTPTPLFENGMQDTYTKFYFQHLSPEQQTEFVRLMNTKDALIIDFLGHFYALPFFCRVKPTPGATE